MTVSSAPQQNSITTVGDRVRPVAIGTPVAALYFIGDRAAFVGNEETITLVSGDGEKVAVTVHGGAILSSVSDGTRIVTRGRWFSPLPGSAIELLKHVPERYGNKNL